MLLSMWRKTCHFVIFFVIFNVRYNCSLFLMLDWQKFGYCSITGDFYLSAPLNLSLKKKFNWNCMVWCLSQVMQLGKVVECPSGNVNQAPCVLDWAAKQHETLVDTLQYYSILFGQKKYKNKDLHFREVEKVIKR